MIVSYDGTLDFSADLLHMLKRNRSEIVLISSMKEHVLSNHGTYNLYLASMEDHNQMIVPFSSKLSLLYVFDMLYAQYFKIDYEQNVRYIQKSREKIKLLMSKK